MAGQFTLRGVRSHAARKNLIAMRSGDRVLFYHSQKEKVIVGILKVICEAYPGPTSSDPKWMTCDFAPIKSFSRPVTLKELRSNPELAELPLLRQPRLSVMPARIQGEISLWLVLLQVELSVANILNKLFTQCE